ncbi:hypothetical protein FQZ97_607010 [compost metagenome]
MLSNGLVQGFASKWQMANGSPDEIRECQEGLPRISTGLLTAGACLLANAWLGY